MELFNSPTTQGPHSPIGGERRTYEFDNGYIASVIIGPYSYGGDRGLYELAVMDAEGLRYDTEITGDVIGHLTPQEVDSLLVRIRDLEWKEPE